MRKIFIDGGANKGQSTRSFLREWPNAKDFEIFMFEPSPKGEVLNILKSLENNKISLEPNAIWTHDGEITFYEKASGSQGNTLLHEKTQKEKRSFTHRKIKCISLSKWIKDNFSEDDYIILKLDIEGAEYDVLPDLKENKVLSFIDLFFCEIHGSKCGKSFEESMELLDICSEAGLVAYRWNGETFKFKEYKERVYTKKHLNKEFAKWKKRGL